MRGGWEPTQKIVHLKLDNQGFQGADLLPMTRYGAVPRHDSPGLCKDTLHALDRVAHLSLAMGDLNTAERQTRTALEHLGKSLAAPRP